MSRLPTAGLPAQDPEPGSHLRAILLCCIMPLVVVYARVYGDLFVRAAPGVELRFAALPFCVALYAVSVWAVCRYSAGDHNRRQTLLIVLLGAFALRAVILCGLVPDNPDLGRHLWEGRVLLEGYNPYAAAPSSPVYDDLKSRLKASGDNLYGGGWVVLAGVRSIYGPVATALFAVPHLLPYDRELSLRLLMTTLDLLALLVIVRLLAALALPPAWAIVYAWSPAVLDAFADRGQVDAAVVLFVVLCLLLAVRRRHALCGAVFALAILVKISPALLALPLLRAGRWRFAVVCGAVSLLCLLPFAGAGAEGLSGFSDFATWWQENDFAYSVATWALRPLVGHSEASRIAKALVAVAAVAFSMYAAWRLDPDDPRELAHALAAVAAATIVLSPVTFPWYTAPLVALTCVTPRASYIALGLAPMLWHLKFLKAPEASPWHVVTAAFERWAHPWRLPVYSAVTLLWIREVLRARGQAVPTDVAQDETA